MSGGKSIKANKKGHKEFPIFRVRAWPSANTIKLRVRVSGFETLVWFHDPSCQSPRDNKKSQKKGKKTYR